MFPEYFQLVIAAICLASLIICDDECRETICNPRAGDLLIGRESFLRASSTCGLNEMEKFCIVIASDRSKKPKCDICYSKEHYHEFTNPYSHRIENVVSRLPRDNKRWWQSESGKNNVTIEINFESEFQFIYTQLRFKTYRPAAMYIERSKDYGKSWKKYAYFSEDCSRDFPSISSKRRNDINEIFCTSEFSSISPSEGGTVLFVASPGDFYSDKKYWNTKRNDVTAVTNLRVTFVRLHTFGDSIIDNNPKILNKYYYAISEWIIRGRCSCYGHASKCKPKEGQIQTNEMVFGVCECQHNTKGQHCELCEDFYNDTPWNPATRTEANECRKCICNNHATSCHFNPVVYHQSGNKSGGVCDGCQHNTEGKNCERCQGGYYRNVKVAIHSVDTCLRCQCNPKGSKFSSLCVQENDAELKFVAGSCICKDNIAGYYCDKCRVGYWNYDIGCIKCKCKMEGTLNNEGCDLKTGTCSCKANVIGDSCSKCKDGFFNLSYRNPLGCTYCGCSKTGSLNSQTCNQYNGQCNCKPGYTGRTCDTIKDGWFVEKPKYKNMEINITLNPVLKTGMYNFIITLDTENMGENDKYDLILTIDHNLPSKCRVPLIKLSITKKDKYLLIPNTCLEKDLHINIKIRMIEIHRSLGHPPEIVNIIVIPLIDAEVSKTREILTNCLRSNLTVKNKCEFMNEIKTKLEPTSTPSKCECDVTGSLNNICSKYGGQCACLPNVSGRKCDKCAINSYGFSARGCKKCKCNSSGSLSLQCDNNTGSCICKKGAEGKKCVSCKGGYWNFPLCQKCNCNDLSEMCDQQTGHCINCKDNTFGENCDQCIKGYYGDPVRRIPCLKCKCPGLGKNLDYSNGCKLKFNTTSMICLCKEGYAGTTCDSCDENFYGNPKIESSTCKPCTCSNNTDLTDKNNCDKKTGECLKCLYHTSGFNCEKCTNGFFGNGATRSCKKCVCNNLGTDLTKKDICNTVSGQCNCLPNVYGVNCDRCITDHFNLISGKGCQQCLCSHPIGSINSSCNELTGQCFCQKGRSGRQCNQCEDGFWGNPAIESGCQKCQCNTQGSITHQCSRDNGVCKCKTGVTGVSCDRCAKGTSGILPNCIPCGECWNYWNNVTLNLNNSLSNFGNIKNVIRSSNETKELVNLNAALKMLNDLKLPDDMDKLNEILRQQIPKFVYYNSSHSILQYLNKLIEYENKTTLLMGKVSSNKIVDATSAFNEIQNIRNLMLKNLKKINQTAAKIEENRKLVKAYKDDLNLNLTDFLAKQNYSQSLFEKLNKTMKNFQNFICGYIVNCKKNCGDKCHLQNCFVNIEIECSNKKSILNIILEEIQKKKLSDLIDKTKILEVLDKKLKQHYSISSQILAAAETKNNDTIKIENKIKDLISKLKEIPDQSISEGDFKTLLEKVNNFTLTARKNEANLLIKEILSKRNLLTSIDEILKTSRQNRKDCNNLKNHVTDAKNRTINRIRLINDLSLNEKRIISNLNQTKSLIKDWTPIFKQVEKKENEINKTNGNTADIIKLLKKSLKVFVANKKKINDTYFNLQSTLSNLDFDVLTNKLKNKKIKLTDLMTKLKKLNEGENKKLNQSQETVKLKLKNLNDKIKQFSELIKKESDVVKLKEQKIKQMEITLEQKLNQLTDLQNSIHAKAKYQDNCMPV